MITRSDVEHVALLSRLELSEGEKELFTRQLGDILRYVQKLNELDTSDVPPTAHVLPLKNVYREDVPGEHMPVEKVLANAPEREDDFFKVPKIV